MPSGHTCDFILWSFPDRKQNYRHNVTKEGIKNLIKTWCRIPLDQRKDRMHFSFTWRESYNLKGTTALVQSVPDWVLEIRNEEGGEEFKNLQQEDFDSWAHGTELTLLEGDKKLVISFQILLGV